MKLLREVNEHVDHLIEESAEGKKRHYLSGVFMEAGVKNRNGRSYPDEVLSNEALRFQNEIVKENRGFGELGHPQGPAINLDRVAILIKEINKAGTQFMGKALVTETPMGQIVKGLLEGEAKLGVSSRALGSLKEEDHVMIVQPDLKLITVDVVADPSAPNAFVQGIMEGNSEWVEDGAGGWKTMEIIENTKKKIKKMSVVEINERKVQLFEDFLVKVISKQH